MKNAVRLSKIVSERNKTITRLELNDLRSRKILVKKRDEAFGRVRQEISRLKEDARGKGGLLGGLLGGIGGGALLGRGLRGLKSRIPGRGGRVKPGNKIVPGPRSKVPASRGLRSGLRMGRANAAATIALTGVDYGLRRADGQTQVQATSGALSTTAGGLAGFVAGAKGGALAGGAIGAFFGGAGAIPGAAIGGVLGGLLGSFGGASLGAAVSDRVTGVNVGADQRRRNEERKAERVKPLRTQFGSVLEEFDRVLDDFSRLAGKNIFFIEGEYKVAVTDPDDESSNPTGTRPPTPRRPPDSPPPATEEVEPSSGPFEAEAEEGATAERHKGRDKQFRYGPNYQPTGIEYEEIPSTPSNKVVEAEALPELVKTYTDKFDPEKLDERQKIETPYGTLLRKPSTLFAPAGFQFINRDQAEDKRFRAQQTIQSTPVQLFGIAETALSIAGLARGVGSRGVRNRNYRPAETTTSQTASPTTLKRPTIPPVQPVPLTLPGQGVNSTERIRKVFSSATPRTIRKRQNSMEQRAQQDAQRDQQSARPDDQDLRDFARNLMGGSATQRKSTREIPFEDGPLITNSPDSFMKLAERMRKQYPNFDSLMGGVNKTPLKDILKGNQQNLALLAPLAAFGISKASEGEGNGAQQIQPFQVPTEEESSVMETIMPFSKYLEYESYMKVWK